MVPGEIYPHTPPHLPHYRGSVSISFPLDGSMYRGYKSYGGSRGTGRYRGGTVGGGYGAGGSAGTPVPPCLCQLTYPPLIPVYRDIQVPELEYYGSLGTRVYWS